MLSYKTQLGENQEISQEQSERYERLCADKNNGKLTLNQTYRIAQEPFLNASGEQVDGFKGGFNEWIQVAKDNGWIDKAYATINQYAEEGKIDLDTLVDGNKSQAVAEEKKRLEKEIEDKANNKKIINGVLVVGGILLAVYVGSKLLKNKQ